MTFSNGEGKGDVSVLGVDNWQELFAEGSLVYCGSENVLQVKEVKADSAKLEVQQGGILHDATEIFVPSTRRSPSVDQIPDEAWLACENPHVDYIILPSFETAEELQKVVDKIQKGISSAMGSFESRLESYLQESRKLASFGSWGFASTG